MCYSRLLVSSPLLFSLLFFLRQLIKNIGVIFKVLEPGYIILLYLLLITTRIKLPLYLSYKGAKSVEKNQRLLIASTS